MIVYYLIFDIDCNWVVGWKIVFFDCFCCIGVLRPQTPDPLLSASNKSGQKCLSAHFAISNNVSLRSPLVKFEAEPNQRINFNFFYFLKTLLIFWRALYVAVKLFYISQMQEIQSFSRYSIFCVFVTQAKSSWYFFIISM